jgi:choline-glycine betaine transporter
LCTTIAAGIVFWAAAEPIQHILYPKASLEFLLSARMLLNSQ